VRLPSLIDSFEQNTKSGDPFGVPEMVQAAGRYRSLRRREKLSEEAVHLPGGHPSRSPPNANPQGAAKVAKHAVRKIAGRSSSSPYRLIYDHESGCAEPFGKSLREPKLPPFEPLHGVSLGAIIRMMVLETRTMLPIGQE